MSKMMTIRTALAASTALFFALSGPSFAEGERAGVAAAVNPQAAAYDGQGKGKLISLGDPVIRNHRIETSAEGLVQILLADGTAFTIGPNSSVVIDNFVYDPKSKTASLTATMTKGALRFIGGKASKKGGNVTINTPIGTAGIRGAVVDINLDGKDAQGRSMPPHMSLVYGKEVELTGRGRPQRLFKSGFSIISDGTNSRVSRTPLDWVSGLQQHLAGRPGFDGGSINRPNDQTVEKSRLERSNSGVAPSQNKIPVPQPKPVNKPSDQLAGDSTRDTLRPVPVTIVTPDASGNANQAVGLITAGTNGGSKGTYGTSGRFTLPTLAPTATLSEHQVSGYARGVGRVSGTAYTGTGDFVAYMLKNANNKPFYVIGGTPANAVTTLASGEIMRYRLEPDALASLTNGEGTTIPFVGDASGFTDNTVSSDLYVMGVQPTAGSTVIGRSLQASLDISGTGATQTSAINVFAGTVGLLQGGGYGLTGGMAGSSRTDATDTASHNQGAAETIGSQVGKDQFLGANGEYLVIGSGDLPDVVAGGVEQPLSGYDNVHVGSRTDVATDDTRSFGSNDTTGFASGVGTMGNSSSVLVGRTDLDFNAANGSLSGTIAVGASGEFLVDFDAGDDSAYLSDQLMAATTRDGSYMVSSDVVAAKIFDNGTGGKTDEICQACDFMTWGWWGRNSSATADKTVHLGNWIVGKQPAGSEVTAALGTATYNGNAVGTVVNGGSQYIATGSMEATMNFLDREGRVTISDFDGKTLATGVDFGSNTATFSGTETVAGVTTTVDGAFASNGVDPVKGVMGNFTAVDGTWSAGGIFAGSRNSQ